MLKKKNYSKRLFTDQEIIEFERNLMKSRQKYKMIMIMKFAINAGLRIAEILSLTKDSIDLQNRRINYIAKGKKVRSQKISYKFSLLIEKYLDQEQIVLPSEKLFPMTQENVQWTYRHRKVPSPHSFRNHYAIKLLNETNNLKYVQQRMGHKSIATTADSYLEHWDNDDLDKSLEDL